VITLPGLVSIASSILSDFFVASRGTVLGIFYWGIYIGYALSYLIGNYLLDKIGWRWIFISSGIPGVVVGVLLGLLVKEPVRGGLEDSQHKESSSGLTSAAEGDPQRRQITKKKEKIAAQRLLDSDSDAEHHCQSHQTNEKDDQEDNIGDDEEGDQVRMLKEEENKKEGTDANNANANEIIDGKDRTILQLLLSSLLFFLKHPAFIFLTVASALRNAAGYVWVLASLSLSPRPFFSCV